MSDQTERIEGDSWAEVLEGPYHEPATLVLRDDSGDPTRPHKPKAEIKRQGWGRYQLLEKIGEGGMGVVYLALDTKLGRKVAVKILQIPDHREEDTQRFIIEARITSQLEHPNIVPVYEVGRTPEDELFYTMKRIRGRELGDVLKAGELTLVRKIQVLIDVCNALEYAHARNVVHRDIKPDNILIGDYGEVLLADWGLARVLDRPLTHELSDKAASSPRILGDSDSGARLTQFGEVIGTIAYMSPEQARGDHHLVGPETDIYALGGVLYQVLTDKPPFVFDKGVSAREMLIEVAESEPRRPRTIDTSIPPDLEAIVVKAMAPKMKERYFSISGMRGDLMAFVENRPVSAHKAGVMFRLSKMFDRHRKAFRTGLAAVMALFVCLTAFAVQLYQQKEKLADEKARTQALLAEVERQNTDKTQMIERMRASEKARAVAEAQRELIEAAENLLTEGRFLLENDPSSKDGLQKIRAAVKLAPDYHRTHYMLARTLAGRAEFPGALDAIEACLKIEPDFTLGLWTRAEILEAMADSERDEAKRVDLRNRLRDTYKGIMAAEEGTGSGLDTCAEGYVLLMDGKQDKAREKFQVALKAHPNLPQAQVGLLSCFGISKQMAQFKRYAKMFASSQQKRRKADEFAKQKFEQTVNRWQGMELSKAQENYRQGTAAFNRGDYRTGLTCFGESARLYRRQKLEGQECRSLTWVAYCHAKLNRRDKAVEILSEVLPRLEKNEDEEAMTVRVELGKLLNFLGEHEKAIDLLSRVVKEQIDRRELVQAAYYMGWVAQIYMHLGELGKARSRLDAATEMIERGKGRRLLDLDPLRAKLLRYEGEPKRALKVYQKLLKGKSNTYRYTQRLTYQLGEAGCYIDMNNLVKAEKMAREVEATAKRMRLHSQALSAALLRMDIQRRQGHLELALKIGIATRQRLINPFLDMQIGSLAMMLGKHELAETHLKRAQEGYNPPHYPLLFRVLLAKQRGTLETFRKKLGNSLDGKELWPAPLVRYLLGQTSLDELHKAARHPLYQMEMAYFIGEKELAEKASIRALDQFKLCTESGLVDRFTHQCSLDRLKALSK